jgi:hypothetical protein
LALPNTRENGGDKRDNDCDGLLTVDNCGVGEEEKEEEEEEEGEEEEE